MSESAGVCGHAVKVLWVSRFRGGVALIAARRCNLVPWVPKRLGSIVLK